MDIDQGVIMFEDLLFQYTIECKLAELKSLLAQGGNVNAVNSDGYTPLMLAAMKGDSDIIVCLIDAGASIFSTDRSGHTSLILAAMNCNTEAVRILIDYSCRQYTRACPSVVSLYTANSLDLIGCSEVARLLRSNPV